MKKANMKLSYKELMILDHAIRLYLNRCKASEQDLEDENKLLDRVNNNIKCIKY